MADRLPQWLHWKNLDNVQYVGYSIYFAIFHVLLDILPFTPPGTPNPGPPLSQYCGLENRELPGGGGGLGMKNGKMDIFHTAYYKWVDYWSL